MMMPFNVEASYQKEIHGVMVATVTNNKDPEGLGRIKVCYPWNQEEGESYWARVISFMAGSNRGAFFLPEVNDEVLIAFELGNMESPVIIGTLWNGQDTPIENNEDGNNNLRKIKSRSGHELIFDDTQSKEKIEIKSKSGHYIRLEDTQQPTPNEKIEITSSGGDQIVLDQTGKKITIKSNTKISIEAPEIVISATSTLTLKGGIVRIN